MNGVAVRATDTPYGANFVKFRPGSDGIGPGTKFQKNISLNFFIAVRILLGVHSCKLSLTGSRVWLLRQCFISIPRSAISCETQRMGFPLNRMLSIMY